MGAFIGYGDVGVWTSNRGRDAFLDWFAAHRCQPHDASWERCKSEANRWTGCCLRLEEFIPPGGTLTVTQAERVEAAARYGPHVAELLAVVSRITRGEWHHLVGSKEALPSHWAPA